MFTTQTGRILCLSEKYFLTKCVSKNKSAVAAAAHHVQDEVKKFEDIPALPGLPVIGNLHQFLKKENADNLFKFFARLRSEHGDIVR